MKELLKPGGFPTCFSTVPPKDRGGHPPLAPSSPSHHRFSSDAKARGLKSLALKLMAKQAGGGRPLGFI